MPALRLALLCLPLVLTACQRAPASVDAEAAPPPPPGPEQLMARRVDQRPRAETTGNDRIRCKEPVASIPCAP